jgi:DNA-binding MarR family transcriptional regulator
MSGSLDAGARRPGGSTWEPLGSPLVLRAGFADATSTSGGSMTNVPPYSERMSRAAVEAKSGLTRRGIVYQYVRAHPGTHVRGMAKELRLCTGDLHYHLFWLEKNGYVKTRKSGFYRFVYPSMMFHERQEILLGILSQETPREILLDLLHDPTLTQGDLARRLRRSQPTVSWHMERLVQLGAVSKERTSRGVAYDVVADRGDIVTFVKSFHPDVWKRWAGRLADVAVGRGAKRGDEGGSVRRVGVMPSAVVELFGHG